jgi:cytidylate kinase
VIVAVDGPAGTGKSSVARHVAEAAGLFYLNSGGFYRAVTWAALDRGVSVDDGARLLALSKSLQLEIQDGRLAVDGTPRHDELRSQGVDAAVAQVSAFPEIRDIVNSHLRRIAGSMDIIAEGRDMTTVVFPDADVKIYLDASLDSRARRRFSEHDGKIPLDTIRRQIAERDEIDRTKAVGNLKLAPEALYIDSSHLTLDQVCDKVLRAIHSHNHTTGETGQS